MTWASLVRYSFPVEDLHLYSLRSSQRTNMYDFFRFVSGPLLE